MIDFQQSLAVREAIFSVTPDNVESLAIAVFRFQYENNQVYNRYCNSIHTVVEQVDALHKIPFLPIQFFKSQQVICNSFTPEMIFESSGTTGSINSQHHVKDLTIYEESFFRTFQQFYGQIEHCCIIGLLPSYLERKNASLVYMVDHLIKKSNHPDSGFYLYDFEKLNQTLLHNEARQQRTILIGVSYALLDFSEQFPMQLQDTIVMETGGMKGRAKEISKQALHEQLKHHLGTSVIHSEYGMTELLSQAYSSKEGIFNCPPWMKILLRAADDPFDILQVQQEPLIGAVNIIDLANVYSCAFIATDDIGKLHPNGSFEILGRLENADIRGCGLMVI